MNGLLKQPGKVSTSIVFANIGNSYLMKMILFFSFSPLRKDLYYFPFRDICYRAAVASWPPDEKEIWRSQMFKTANV